MNCKSLLFCACFASLLSSTPAATVIKILHINPQAKVRAIWQESAQGFESAHPGVKVEFDYLENEAFKAKLPTLLQSKETIDFAKVWLGKEAQTKVAQQGLAIPAVKGTADTIQDPLLKEIAQQIERSEWLESPMDQVLGPDTGRVFNDVSTDIASGNSTPEKGAKVIEESWQQNKQ